MEGEYNTKGRFQYNGKSTFRLDDINSQIAFVKSEGNVDMDETKLPIGIKFSVKISGKKVN